MDTITSSRLSTAVLIITAMLLPIDAAIAQGAMMDGGTMGNEHWYGTGGYGCPCWPSSSWAPCCSLSCAESSRARCRQSPTSNNLINSTLKVEPP